MRTTPFIREVEEIMIQQSCASQGNLMILACSGGSNVGQLSNQAAVELTQEGFGKLSCLAGIGARLSRFVQSARDVPHLMVIDGCSKGCAKATLEHAEVPLRNYVVLTNLGIEKDKVLHLRREDVEKVKEAIREDFERTRGVTLSGAGSPCNCGCG